MIVTERDVNQQYSIIRARIAARREKTQRKYKNGDPVLRDLFATVTVAEASMRWNKHVTSVREAMIAGKLNYRRSGGTWLIQTESLIKLWGQPIPPDTDGVELVLPMWEK